MNRVIHNYTAKYLREKVTERSILAKRLEEYAAANHIPIIEPEIVQLLRLLIMIKKPDKILEIGTAIGYSSIIMAEATARKDIIIDTIERDPRMAEIARENINMGNFEDNITIYQGDAQRILPNIGGKYDLIFIDGAKSHYKEFVEMCLKNLNVEGLIICDDVLFRGMIANDKLVKRRKITIVKKMREFIDYITTNQLLETTIIPLGDGVSISYLKGD
ncbi:MAG: O-methyltransferase [Clostridia bacterium]|nr:O-methyltransferase [Clostridia bacterium]